MILHLIAGYISQNDFKDAGLPMSDISQATFATVLRTVFAIFGAVAVIIVTLAGMKYVLSQGNPQATAQAKNTIMYALIGLVISVSAFSIITFVLGKT